MSYARIMNISLVILVVFESERKKITLIDFSNDTFPIDAVVVNLDNYIWVVRLIYNKT